MQTVCYQIEPFQVANDDATLNATAARFLDFWATWPHPTRLLSRLTPQRYAGRVERIGRQLRTMRSHVDDAHASAWRQRWLLTQRSLYDAVHHGGALMLKHYLLTWVPDDLDLPTLHTRIERCFLTEATPTRLPPVWLHHPLERLHALHPNQPGDPYLAVLMGYDVQGTWNLLTWQALLQLDVPLTVAIDIHTPPKEGFRGTNRAVGDAEDALDHVATKQPHDRRARQARDDAGAANDQLSHQFVHHVGYAVLAEAPTERALQRATQTIDAGSARI